MIPIDSLSAGQIEPTLLMNEGKVEIAPLLWAPVSPLEQLGQVIVFIFIGLGQLDLCKKWSHLLTFGVQHMILL